MRKRTVTVIVVLAGGLALYLSALRGSFPFLASAAVLRPPAPPVPVSAAPVQRQDVPIYLTGLGTVQAYNSVLVKSRVDGQIVKVRPRGISLVLHIRIGHVLMKRMHFQNYKR